MRAILTVGMISEPSVFADSKSLIEILLWLFRGLATCALVALVIWVPQVWEAYWDRRWYGEPLGAATYWRVSGCILAVLIFWQAHILS